jgi:hypothetical protein
MVEKTEFQILSGGKVLSPRFPTFNAKEVGLNKFCDFILVRHSKVWSVPH